MHSGTSHCLVTSRANTKERDGEIKPAVLPPFGAGFWKGFLKRKGRQVCTFILIHTKGPALNSFQASLSLSLQYVAVVGFPAVHRDAARGAPSHGLACPSRHPHTQARVKCSRPSRAHGEPFLTQAALQHMQEHLAPSTDPFSGDSLGSTLIKGHLSLQQSLPVDKLCAAEICFQC